MIFDMQSATLCFGVIVFPDYAFGAPPAEGGGSLGLGGPTREVVLLRGSNSQTTQAVRGTPNRVE